MSIIQTTNVRFGKLVSNIPAESGSLNKDVSFSIDSKKFTLYKPQNTEQEYVIFLLNQAFLSTRLAIHQVEYDEAMLQMREQVEQWNPDQSIDSLIIDGATLTIKGHLSCANKSSVSYALIVRADADQVNIKISLKSAQFQRISLRYSIGKDEQLFGFGAQLSYANLKGKIIPIKVEESGVGRGSSVDTGDIPTRGSYYNTYAPIPVYISNKQRGMYLENTSYSCFDLRQEGACIIDIWDQESTAVFTRGDSPLEIIEKHSYRLGRQKPLPSWAHRSILGLQGGRKKVESITDEAIGAGNPVGAIWIQDWVGKRQTSFGSRLWWRWEADESLYPNFRNFVKGMKQKKVEVLGYINTFLADDGAQYEEAKQMNLLVKNQKGEDYKLHSVGTPMYLLDLTNPQTEHWIKNIIIKNMIDMGLAGWMADFGEYLPYDAVLHSGIDPAIYHNQYSVDWARINAEAIKEAGKEEKIVFFTRAGFTGSAKYSPMFWTGDQLVTFDKHDGLSSAITGILASGISGISLNHSDIGGYTTTSSVKRQKGVFLRWAEMAAFTPFFRTHEGNRPDDNHQFYSDLDTQRKFAAISRLHYALEPYFKYLETEAAELGYPVVRHLFLHYPQDPTTFKLTQEFLLGEDLLICPATQEGISELDGYFPNGYWQSIWSDEIFEGPKWHKIPAPLGQPAAFTRLSGKWSKSIRSSIQNIEL
ncbi:MAG: alpha-glucosidase [Oligoflexales bacterium]